MALAVAVPAAPASADTETRCTELPSRPPGGVRIEVAEVVRNRDDLGRFCRIAGTISPDIRFEMRAPTRDWNRRFLLSGCGGYCGELITERKGYSNSINYALKRGYAAATTDSGHRGNAIDTTWAHNNPDLEKLFAIDWVPLAAAASRALLERLYGRNERFSYFAGCSNGGRTAAKIAQEYPSLFDGIASGCGAFNLANAAVQGV
ncbi:MAG: tannase/feruloyl esterase family alpha/beta hydrolase, partial [Gammaproteobacteria bacterium]|nr:tannase/feruloyl esterase family alpha/beta hydrolase [Gammaproteobacteria bacterium]